MFVSKFPKNLTCKCKILEKTINPLRRFSWNQFPYNNISQSKLITKNGITANKRFQAANYYAKKKEKKSSIDSRAIIGINGVIVGIVGGAIYCLGQSDPENENDPYGNENTVLAYLYRSRDTLQNIKDSVAEPSSELLLPGPLPEPYIQPPYTLVIEPMDVLMHAEYDRQKGWRYRKRPGVDQFLQSLTAPLFEIVIFTHKDGMTAAPLIDGLDPEGYIMYKLFRDSTKYTKGTHVKDLSSLNRDLRKVIILDCDKKTSQLQPRNSFTLKKWEGDPKDISLIELIPFFRTLAISGTDDVRPIMDHYADEEDPVAAFRRNQDLLRQQQEEIMKMQAEQKQKKVTSYSGGLFSRWR